MRFSRRMWAAMVTGLAVMGSSFSTTIAAASDHPVGDSSDLSVEVAEESSGWQGETSANIDALVTKFGAYTYSYLGQLGGVALSSGSQSVNLEEASLASYGMDASSDEFSLQQETPADSGCGVANGLNRQHAEAFLAGTNISCPRYTVPQTYYDWNCVKSIAPGWAEVACAFLPNRLAQALCMVTTAQLKAAKCVRWHCAVLNPGMLGGGDGGESAVK